MPQKSNVPVRVSLLRDGQLERYDCEYQQIDRGNQKRFGLFAGQWPKAEPVERWLTSSKHETKNAGAKVSVWNEQVVCSSSTK